MESGQQVAASRRTADRLPVPEPTRCQANRTRRCRASVLQRIESAPECVCMGRMKLRRKPQRTALPLQRTVLNDRISGDLSLGEGVGGLD